MGQLKFGVVGASGRGGYLGANLALLGAVVQAVCDIDSERAEAARVKLGAAQAFTDYEAMLDGAELDAVIVGTPMPLHVPQAIAALERGIHVLCEVPLAVSVDECRRLVEAADRSTATCAMAENYLYVRLVQIVNAWVRAGLFGECYYAEGEYLHELKAYNEVTPWRRQWQTGIDGITYGTHSLGPILRWMGQRIVRVCCEGAGAHYVDPRGKPYHQDCPVMLAKTTGGNLIKIRVDMTSDRPHSPAYYQLQGTDGVFESARAAGDVDRVWMRALTGSEPPRWIPLDEARRHPAVAHVELPDGIDQPPVGGHGGADYLMLRDFVRSLETGSPLPFGLHEALDMTLPGLISQQSIAEGGRWIEVPDSRLWSTSAAANPRKDAGGATPPS